MTDDTSDIRLRARPLLAPGTVAPTRIVESLSSVIIVVDLDKRVLIFNPAAERLTLCGADDVVGKPLTDIHSAFAELERRHLFERTLQLGVPSEAKDVEFPHPKGRGSLHFDFIVDPLLDDHGRICGAAVMAFDVTELFKLRHQLAVQNEDLVVLHEVSNVLRSTMDMDKALFIICTALTSVGSSGNEHALVFLADERKKNLRGVMATGRYDSRDIWRVWHDLLDPRRSLEGVLEAGYPKLHRRTQRLTKVVSSIKVPLDETGLMLAEVMAAKRTITANDPALTGKLLAIHESLRERFRLESFAAMPLLVEGEAIGVLVADSSKRPRRYSTTTLKKLEMFADQAALAINNGLMFRRLADRAQRDSLTGLFNHGHFQARLQEETDRTRRYGEALSLLMLDIDHFKYFNDTWGHQAGDAVLVGLGSVLLKTVRGSDTAARYGGEEFAVILPVTTMEQAVQLAERLRERIAAATLAKDKDGKALPVTVSVGVAVLTPLMRGAENLIAAADEALYAAKHAGRNRVVAARNPIAATARKPDAPVG